MLETIDELAGQADDADAVRLAAWFHDAIYDPQAESGENEEVSAQLAELELSAYGVEAARVAEIGRLIRLTAKHDCAPDDANGAVLCDADLRVLSLSAARYDEYAAGIRAEYDHIADRDFARGRMTFLQGLSETSLYATDHGREHWEPAARDEHPARAAAVGPQGGSPDRRADPDDLPGRSTRCGDRSLGTTRPRPRRGRTLACRPGRRQRLPRLGTDSRYCGCCRPDVRLVPAGATAAGDDPRDRVRRCRRGRHRGLLVALAVGSTRCSHE